MLFGACILQEKFKHGKALLLKLDSVFCSALNVFIGICSVLSGAEPLHVLIELVEAIHSVIVIFLWTVLEVRD